MSYRNRMKNIEEIMGVEFNGDKEDTQQYMKILNIAADNKKDLIKLLVLMKQNTNRYAHFEIAMKFAPADEEELIEINGFDNWYDGEDDEENIARYNGELNKIESHVSSDDFTLFKTFMMVNFGAGMEKIYYNDIERLEINNFRTTLLNFNKRELMFVKEKTNYLKGIIIRKD